MTDAQTPADLAGDVALPDAPETDQQEGARPAGQDDAENAARGPDGAAGGGEQPAEDGEASRSKQRREQRKAEIQRLRDSEAQALARAQELERELEKIRTKTAGDAPRRDKFDDPDDYIAARAAWEVRTGQARETEAEAQERLRAAEDARKTASTEHLRAAQAHYAEQATEARTRYADFDTVVNDPTVPISQKLAEMIVMSDTPADLVYSIAGNRPLAAQLSALSISNPVEAARHLGRLEASLTAPQARIETRAPPPITPVRGKAGAQKDPADMSPAEFAAWRAKGGTFKL